MISADCLLCPWEAVKLKIQLSRPGFEYPDSLVAALNKAKAEEGKILVTQVYLASTKD